MNYLPSKELLTEILKENVKEVYEIGSNPNFKDNTLLFNLNGCGELCNINIYELVYMCKEWAFENNYYISSERISESFDSFKHKWYIGVNKNWWFHGVTEPEAIFAACQWIIDNRS